MDGLLAMLRETGRFDVPRGLRFGHGVAHDLDGVSPEMRLFCSYHPSQQNTFTGRLTARSFDAVLRKIKTHLDGGAGRPPGTGSRRRGGRPS